MSPFLCDKYVPSSPLLRRFKSQWTTHPFCIVEAVPSSRLEQVLDLLFVQ